MKRVLGVLLLLCSSILAPSVWADPLIGFGPKTDYPTGNTPESVAIGDLNRDGIPDLVVTNLTSTTVSVFLGVGDGTFGVKTDYPTGTAPFGVSIGDLNRDGKLDVVVANLVAATVSVFLGNGDGTLGAKTDFATANRPYLAAIGDLNMDGNPDLAVADEQAPGAVSILINLTAVGGSPPFFNPKDDYPTAGNASSVAIGDFDRDGFADLVVSKSGTNSLATLRGFGDGTFDTNVDFSTGNGPSKVIVADINRDGKLDLISANQSGSNASILFGNGAGGFAAKVNFPVAGTGSASVAVGDFNADSKPDLAVVNAGAAFVSVLANADLNLDGKPDIAVTNSTAASVSVLLSNIVCGLTSITDSPSSGDLWLSAVPNPSTSKTNITFALPRSGPASVEIFDVLGRRLRQWDWPALSAGEHQVEWNGVAEDGHLVPPSVLFYNLRADGQTLKQKIIRMR
jgi:hypothetical protein